MHKHEVEEEERANSFFKHSVFPGTTIILFFFFCCHKNKLKNPDVNRNVREVFFFFSLKIITIAFYVRSKNNIYLQLINKY